MRIRVFLFSVSLAVAASFTPTKAKTLRAETSSSVALTGQVTSAEEGPMEGVIVSAKKAGSTITVSIVSDDQGRYRFPAAKLEPGAYSLRIRAVGYDMEGPHEVEIAKGTATTADLKLTKARDLAAQLSNSEWLASFPGTDQQKASIRNCTHCHTLERIARSRYDVDKLTAVVQRMSTYPQLSFPLMVQKLVAARIGGGEDPLEQRMAGWRRQAQYLSTINLSEGPDWSYSFKTLPRPKGRATKVVYTEYDLPQKTRQPHDVIVDSQGLAWYASFGEMILGKLDPKTGKVTDYQVPRLKANLPTGSLAVRFDEDENIWLGMQFQGGVAKFDQKTEKFQTWSLPPELNGDHVQINQVSPEHHKVDGKVWLQDAGTYTVLRLDEKSGKFEVFEPRRGMLDPGGRLWFGENRANRIGMFDTKTERFQEWMAPTAESWPYDVTADKNGEAWSGGEFSDRVLRLNAKTGEIVEYLLPRFTNIRRVFVDNSTTPVTFWVGNNHAASIVKLEPMD